MPDAIQLERWSFSSPNHQARVVEGRSGGAAVVCIRLHQCERSGGQEYVVCLCGAKKNKKEFNTFLPLARGKHLERQWIERFSGQMWTWTQRRRGPGYVLQAASKPCLDRLTAFIISHTATKGPVYGFQWRHWGAKYVDMHSDYSGAQLLLLFISQHRPHFVEGCCLSPQARGMISWQSASHSSNTTQLLVASLCQHGTPRTSR